MESYHCRAVVIGGGVIGLAVGRALSARLPDVWLVEAEAQVGLGISSRNSEVIHAGIYYPQGSLKARLCVAGRSLLYRYCESRKVPFQRCGKLIVATSDAQREALHAILQHGRANGVGDLTWLESDEVKRWEPEVRAVAAISSPSTGIVDVQTYLKCLEADMQSGGGQVITRAQVARLDESSTGLRIAINGEQPCWLEAPLVINCAGLDATALLSTLPTTVERERMQTWYAKGNYFSYQGRIPFRHLIYPIPEPGGLGIHLTLDQAGQGRFGPDVEWVTERDYQVDPSARERFAAAVSAYWPEVEVQRLQPAYAGIRPKLRPQGEPTADFMIDGPSDHGIKGLYNFLGIESPGLTSSLALADALIEQLSLTGEI